MNESEVITVGVKEDFQCLRSGRAFAGGFAVSSTAM
jgi:hypothetical protein